VWNVQGRGARGDDPARRIHSGAAVAVVNKTNAATTSSGNNNNPFSSINNVLFNCNQPKHHRHSSFLPLSPQSANNQRPTTNNQQPTTSSIEQA